MSTNDAVSLMIVRQVKPGCEEAYAQVCRGISGAAAAAPGFMASHHFPAEGDGQHVTVLQFESVAKLQAWEESEERAAWLQRVDEFAFPQTVAKHLPTGLEDLFVAGGNKTLARPRRYKMAIVLTVVIYALLMTLRPILAVFLSELPGYAAGFLLVSTQVLVMTYLIMPGLTRLLHRWLYR